MLQFLKDRRGGVAPLLALAAIPIFGSVGAAVDYSRANSARAAMQAAVDSAALFIVKEATKQTVNDATGEATAYFGANFHRSDVTINSVVAVPNMGGSTKSVTVSAQGSIKTVIAGVLGISTIALSVNATADSKFDGHGCVLALDKTASGAFTGQGSTTVNLKGCSLYDNSNNKDAMTVGGTAKVNALSVGVVGGITAGSTVNADYGVTTGIGPVDDPYKDVEPPPPGPCSDNNFKATTSVTISPGVYCGGISIHSGATVKLEPGVYYLDGGDLIVNGNAGVVGNGVTLVFTAKNRKTYGTAQINGSATVQLTAPSFGPTAGIVMFGDRNIPSGTSFKLTGGANQEFGGAVYVPTGSIEFSGGNGTSSSCTQLIGGMVNFSGMSALAINCSAYKTKDFGVWTIRLTS